MKIATIYNDVEDVRMSVNWDETTGEITYQNIETGEEWSADETAPTLKKALDDTYDRYYIGWGLEFEDL